jgi:hypothetical protein
VAVSSAMADGSMDAESKEALEQLKGSFGDFLDGGSADNIVSEVAVMRAMHSLQQLLAEQGVSDSDVAELRKMCSDLGVNIDEMMANADSMGDALGPEAKQFVGGLRSLLNDGDGGAGLANAAANSSTDEDADEDSAMAELSSLLAEAAAMDAAEDAAASKSTDGPNRGSDGGPTSMPGN